jgi:endonuclease YncB( thermonuclease family)
LKDISTHESRRLADLLREEKSKNDAHPLSRILSQNGGVAGFENLDNARLVTADTVSGDHLVIEHEGQRLPIRLLWIRCAPMDEKDDFRKALSKYFGMDLDGTSALARTAREFSMGYLDGKPLRLLLRPGKDKDGSQAALLFLPDVGLYQNVLVQQGLAAVQTPAKEIRRGIVENSLISTLLELEESAKRLKNGAWSLGTEEVKP